MRTILALLLLTLATTAGAADWYRYEAPPRGRTVFDQVLSGDLVTQLRLPRTGRYYVELIRERGPAGDAEPPLAASLEFTVARGKRPLLARSVDVTYAPGERARTLFWLNVPDSLPDRTRLAFNVSLRGADPAQLAATPLRLQITRKLEMAPWFVR